jgi:hypothetical protein
MRLIFTIRFNGASYGVVTDSGRPVSEEILGSEFTEDADSSGRRRRQLGHIITERQPAAKFTGPSPGKHSTPWSSWSTNDTRPAAGGRSDDVRP